MVGGVCAPNTKFDDPSIADHLEVGSGWQGLLCLEAGKIITAIILGSQASPPARVEKNPVSFIKWLL